MRTHSSILAYEIPWTEEPGRLQVTRLQKVGHTEMTQHAPPGLLTWALAQVTPFSLVQFSCPVQLFVTPRNAARQASLSITNFQSLLKLMSIESVMPFNRLILCCPLFLLPSIIPSIRVFSNESVLRITWPKYWSFSFSISPSNEYSRLTSFRIDWLDLLAVQGTLKSLLQYHSSVQFSSVAQPCLTLCDPVDCSMPGFPVHHQFPEQSISSLAPSYVYSPTLTSIQAYWKNYSFDQTDLCQQSNAYSF